MANFTDFDLEVENNKEAAPEHFNGTVATAGVPVTITPTNGNPISSAIIINQNKGPNANDINDLLYVNFTAGSTYTTIQRGGNLVISGSFTSIKIDTNVNGTKYEVIVVS
jgi:hypothetical protein